MVFYKDICNNDNSQVNVNVMENFNENLQFNDNQNIGSNEVEIAFRGKLVCFLDSLKSDLNSDYRTFYDNQMNVVNILNEAVDSILSQFNENQINEMDSLCLKSLCLEILCNVIANRLG